MKVLHRSRVFLVCAMTIGAFSSAGCASESSEAGTSSGEANASCKPGETADGGSCIPAGTQANGCAAGTAALDGGGCYPAGKQPNGCAAGQLADATGACVPAGIPANQCGTGFESDGAGGCRAILPATACSSGLLAAPGDTACSEIAPCGQGDYGDIPTDATTQYVNPSYAGGGSDGSAAKPWLTIADALVAAAPGALVALASGSYAEHVLIENKPVRLWGRCPALVEIVGSTAKQIAVVVADGSDGTEVRGIAVRGDSAGIGVSGSKDVIVDAVWIHDTTNFGFGATNDFGATDVTLKRSLVEGATSVAIYDRAATMTVEQSAARDTKVGSTGFGSGFDIEYDVTTKTRGAVTFRQSLVEGSVRAGGQVLGSDLTFESSVLRSTSAPTTAPALGLYVGDTSGERGSLVSRGSVFDDNPFSSVVIVGSDATIDASVVRNTQPDATEGKGIGMSCEAHDALRSKVVVRSSLFEHNQDVGISAPGSDVELDGVIIRDTASRVTNPPAFSGMGIVAGLHPITMDRATLTVRGALLDRNADTAVLISGGDATVDGTAITNTQPNGGARGCGVWVQPNMGASTLALRSSALENNRWGGVVVDASEATVESTVVKGTTGGPDVDLSGVGMIVAVLTAGGRPKATVDGSVFDSNQGIGLAAFGADLTVDGVVVRGTLPSAMGTLGRGIHIQHSSQLGQPANAAIRGSIIEQNVDLGLLVFNSDATIDTTVVRGTKPQVHLSVTGDGITVASDGTFPANAVVSGAQVEDNARSGLMSFGASLSVGATSLDCNPIQLDGEKLAGQGFSVQDLGGNACGCSGKAQVCQVLTSSFEPPTPVSDTPISPTP